MRNVTAISGMFLVAAAGISGGIAQAGPKLYDMEIYLYSQKIVENAKVSFSLQSSRHATNNYQSTSFSWDDSGGNNYYICTTPKSAVDIPPKARTGGILLTVDPNGGWNCQPKDADIPVTTVVVECQADGRNTDIATGQSRQVLADGRVRSFSTRYDSNSANCQVTLNGRTLSAPGWLSNKRARMK